MIRASEGGANDGKPTRLSKDDKGKGVDKNLKRGQDALRSPTGSEHYWADTESSVEANALATGREQRDDHTTPKAVAAAPPLVTIPLRPTTPDSPTTPLATYTRKGKKRARIETPTPPPRKARGAPLSMPLRGTPYAAANGVPLGQPSWLRGQPMAPPGIDTRQGEGRTIRAMRTEQEEREGEDKGEKAGGVQSMTGIERPMRM